MGVPTPDLEAVVRELGRRQLAQYPPDDFSLTYERHPDMDGIILRLVDRRRYEKTGQREDLDITRTVLRCLWWDEAARGSEEAAHKVIDEAEAAIRRCFVALKTPPPVPYARENPRG